MTQKFKTCRICRRPIDYVTSKSEHNEVDECIRALAKEQTEMREEMRETTYRTDTMWDRGGPDGVRESTREGAEASSEG